MTLPIACTESWLNILNISQQLLNSTSEGNWDKSNTLSKQRHEKLIKHFQDFPISPENALINQQHMVAFTEIENGINTAIAVQKKRLIEESQLMKTQRLASKAYGLSQS